jgi:sulfoxide reductase heme-binding subunit YedZ
MTLDDRRIAALKAALFIACLLPALRLGWLAAQDALGANPIEALTRGLGDWALNFLLITLTVTPLRRVTGWSWLGRMRRMLGLFAFFYALLHVSGYVVLDQFFDWREIFRDIVKRPFITVGFVTFVILVPLAATSTHAMVRRLGGLRWQRLHRAVYLAALLAVLHYVWMVKIDVAQPAVYGAVVAFLLGIRLYWRLRPKPALVEQMQRRKGRVIPIVVER